MVWSMAATASTPPADCAACPRLVALRNEVREAHPDYHAAPVAAWGRPDARLLIVGLAPGMHGANRTGRPFTGDASGDFLFDALHRHGFATSADVTRARLNNVRITNAVKCLPPGNRPIAAEVRGCRPYLVAEIAELTSRRPRRNRCLLCLGRLAHEATAAALGASLGAFGHGRVHEIAAHCFVVDTYHPSRQNTNTGRLTRAMLDHVLTDVRRILSGCPTPDSITKPT
jgi:uracil-DNA glycosylase family 4